MHSPQNVDSERMFAVLHMYTRARTTVSPLSARSCKSMSSSSSFPSFPHFFPNLRC